MYKYSYRVECGASKETRKKEILDETNIDVGTDHETISVGSKNRMAQVPVERQLNTKFAKKPQGELLHPRSLVGTFRKRSSAAS